MAKLVDLRLCEQAQLWFPNLAAQLVFHFMSRRELDRDLFDQYGTSRWLARDTEGLAPNGGNIRIGPHTARIEYLPDKTAARFGGLHFADDHEPQLLEQIQAAADLLTQVPGMADAVGSVVKSIHPLRALTDHDVSHSTPELPFSVFVSIPEMGERDASLRVAESLIHESMHLQLTLLDSIEPLVVDDHIAGYSPWKNELRPLTGLLHGLYVFAVIHQALGVLMGVNYDWREYCRKRNSAIEGEIASLSEAPDGLTEVGMALWRRCRKSIAA